MTQMICPIVCPYDEKQYACHHKECHEVNEGCDTDQGDCPHCIQWTEDFNPEFLKAEDMRI